MATSDQEHALEAYALAVAATRVAREEVVKANAGQRAAETRFERAVQVLGDARAALCASASPLMPKKDAA